MTKTRATYSDTSDARTASLSLPTILDSSGSVTVLSFSHLSYHVPDTKGSGEKALVDDVSVEIKAGELLAIMVRLGFLPNSRSFTRDLTGSARTPHSGPIWRRSVRALDCLEVGFVLICAYKSRKDHSPRPNGV